MPIGRAVINLLRYGVGPGARRKRKEAKRAAKRRRFESERWDRDDDFARRKYDSYEQYVEHQASKLARVAHRLDRNRTEELAEFRERFEMIEQLRDCRVVLCLAARLGTEVEALHGLGFFAVGQDLNPGEDNPYVLPGDFHAVVFPDGSVDAIYCNAIDHAFDIEKLLAEISRLLRAGGLFIAEIEVGFGEGHVPGDFEAMHWRDSQQVIDRMAEAGGLEVETVHDLGMTRRNHRKLIVYRKP